MPILTRRAPTRAQSTAQRLKRTGFRRKIRSASEFIQPPPGIPNPEEQAFFRGGIPTTLTEQSTEADISNFVFGQGLGTGEILVEGERPLGEDTRPRSILVGDEPFDIKDIVGIQAAADRVLLRAEKRQERAIHRQELGLPRLTEAQKKREGLIERNRRGRSGTILTGAQGVQDDLLSRRSRLG